MSNPERLIRLRKSILGLSPFAVESCAASFRNTFEGHASIFIGTMGGELHYCPYDVADITGFSRDTIDKYMHYFIGLDEGDLYYHEWRMSRISQHAPLLRDVYYTYHGVIQDRDVPAEHACPSHRALSSRALLFVLVAPASVFNKGNKERADMLRSVRATIQKAIAPSEIDAILASSCVNNDPPGHDLCVPHDDVVAGGSLDTSMDVNALEKAPIPLEVYAQSSANFWNALPAVRDHIKLVAGSDVDQIMDSILGAIASSHKHISYEG
jgi:hypothetical protein